MNAGRTFGLQSQKVGEQALSEVRTPEVPDRHFVDQPGGVAQRHVSSAPMLPGERRSLQHRRHTHNPGRREQGEATRTLRDAHDQVWTVDLQ